MSDLQKELRANMFEEIKVLRASNARLVEALKGLLPLAEWALGEQSPPGFGQPLVDAAESAINSAEGNG